MVFAFADKRVANLAAGVEIVNSPAGTIVSVGEDEKNLTLVPIVRPIEPGLGSVGLGPGTTPRRLRSSLCRNFVGGIEIKHALTGVAVDDAVPAAHFVVGLGTKHHLATHALLVPHFGNARAAEL